MFNLKKKSNLPYSTIARYYDELMYDVDYAGWVDYILRIFRRYNLRGTKVLDIACGTGIVAGYFAKYRYDITGIDLSEAMLEVAQERVQSKYPQTQFIQADMTQFDLREHFDAVICLYDSLNYLLKESQLQKAYQCAYNHLRPGGLYIFDMNTEFALSQIWGEGTTVRETKNLTSIWESEYNATTRISTLKLTFFARQDNGYYLRGQETHKETFYPYSTIRRLLDHAGFAQVDIYEHLEFTPPSDKTYRIMVVAKKGRST